MWSDVPMTRLTFLRAIALLALSSCGAFNEAQAQQCSNCAAPRDADAPRGSLTLAAAPKRERPLPLEQCGFSPFGGDG